jgi:hypothetical protein
MTKTEVSETDEDVSIVVELPGVSPQDVDVSLDDDVLTIRAQISQGTAGTDKRRDYSLMERDYGCAVRAFRLRRPPTVTPRDCSTSRANKTRKHVNVGNSSSLMYTDPHPLLLFCNKNGDEHKAFERETHTPGAAAPEQIRVRHSPLARLLPSPIVLYFFIDPGWWP